MSDEVSQLRQELAEVRKEIDGYSAARVEELTACIESAIEFAELQEEFCRLSHRADIAGNWAAIQNMLTASRSQW